MDCEIWNTSREWPMDVDNLILLNGNGDLIRQGRAVGLVAVPLRAWQLAWLNNRTLDSVNRNNNGLASLVIPLVQHFDLLLLEFLDFSGVLPEDFRPRLLTKAVPCCHLEVRSLCVKPFQHH
jgi:hypothetical protein